jgi:hypothetical protein
MTTTMMMVVVVVAAAMMMIMMVSKIKEDKAEYNEVILRVSSALQIQTSPFYKSKTVINET